MRSDDGKIDLRCSVDVNRFDDEQKKVWGEALFRSKGQANTKIGAILVTLGATADEVVKFTTDVKDHPAFTKTHQTRRKAIEKALDQVWRSVPDFWDTVKGRKMKEEDGELLVKVGLNPDVKIPATQLDAKLSQYYINKTYRITGESYMHHRVQYNLQTDSSMARALSRATAFKPLMNVKFKEDDRTSSSSLRDIMDRTASPNDFKIPNFDKYRKYEVDSLANMDENVSSAIQPYQLWCDCINNAFAWRFRNYPNADKTIQLNCVTEGFYDVCKELGIVGVLDQAVSGRSWCSESTCAGILKSVIRMAGTYRRLVKGGFAESVARETVLAEINENITKRASRPIVRFYPRNDYKDTPAEELEKVKKVSKSSGGSSQPRRVLTLDELRKMTKEEE